MVHSVSCNLPRNITYLKSLSQKKTWICSKEFLSNISPSLTLSCSFFWSTVDGEQRQSSKITFCFCVRWKLIKGNFTQMESASQKEELSHSTTGDQLWELTITNPREKIFNRRYSSESPQQEKVCLTSPRRTQENPSNPAKEKGSLPWTLTFPQWSLLKQSFPTYYFSL